MPTEQDFERLRNRMVETQILARGVTDLRVLDAMRRVRRHEFVDGSLARDAYADQPLSIGHGQTISQPYIVAWMSELLALEPAHEVLEAGTGCGYQTAVLAMLCRHVFSLELVPELSRQAAIHLQRAGIDNVTLRIGDAHAGWPGGGEFDRILVAAAAITIPQALTRQLSPGGRMVLPVGTRGVQQMTLVTKDRHGHLHTQELGAVAFVPLVPSSPGVRPGRVD
ncbi:MAG: protein-L-isoaspartate(D-aspartate) O-methyltransferase [Planctomycetes bacterium]|nr:protein-L-isoaspartate(D-aspartate) O-methyltransferase [Planctomycetota bacterium]